MKYNKKDIKIIRIIPMSTMEKEFLGKTYKMVQNDYFLRDLPIRNGNWYYYAVSGLNANGGELLLFQYDNSIIASAILQQVLNFKKKDEDSNGAFVLEKDSINTFTPIDNHEIKDYIKNFERFGQGKLLFTINEVDIDKLIDRISN